MHTGVFVESYLGRFMQCVTALQLLVHLCLSAPGLTATHREEPGDVSSAPTDLLNPFSSGPEDRRSLQSYIQSNLKDQGQGGAEINSWEQELFFLVRLYDFDHGGQLDGLEIMKLLSDYNSHHAAGAPTNELVVSMVDFLLRTQDLNQDGLLVPSELLSPPLRLTKDPDGRLEEEVGANHVEASNHESPDKKEGIVEVHEKQREEADVQLQEEEQPRHDAETDEDGLEKQAEVHGLPEPFAADQQTQPDVPVHQGQPEM